MYFVYFLRSESNLDKTYIGYTKCLVDRLKQHNDGNVGYTQRYTPWRVEAYILAETLDLAVNVEEYFKSSSGKEKFKRYKDANPDSENPIKEFFEIQSIGRKFGMSRFEVGRLLPVMKSCISD